MSKSNDLRNTYRACLKLADETDSKKEDALLRKEASDALKELKEVCPHDLTIITQREYKGSYSDDYSDSCPEERICMFCTTQECARDNKFKILVKFCGESWGGNIVPQFIRPMHYLASEVEEAIDLMTDARDLRLKVVGDWFGKKKNSRG